jgi:hypothetical protein
MAGLSDEDRASIIAAIAEEPSAGDVMAGTGGARKRRFAGRGKGKSGGYRTVSFYAGDNVPVLMLALIDKGERANLSKADQNALGDLLATYASSYRAGLRKKLTKLRSKKP